MRFLTPAIAVTAVAFVLVGCSDGDRIDPVRPVQGPSIYKGTSDIENTDTFIRAVADAYVTWAKGAWIGSPDEVVTVESEEAVNCLSVDAPLWACGPAVLVYDRAQVQRLEDDPSGGASVLALTATVLTRDGDRYCAAGEFVRWTVDGNASRFTVSETQATAATAVIQGKPQQDNYQKGLTGECRR